MASVKPTPAQVDSESSSYCWMKEEFWDLVNPLLAGTKGMRETGERLLPRQPKETPERYNARVKRTYLYEAYADTTEGLAEKPFQQSVSIKGKELTGKLAMIEENVDLMGTDLTSFAQELLRGAVRYGAEGVLTDAPNLGGRQLTAGAEAALKLRPSFVRIPLQSILGFRTQRGINGQEELTQLRFKETRTEPDGDYGEVKVSYIRVINAPAAEGERGTWQLHRQAEEGKGEYRLHEHGTHSYAGIPFEMLYTLREGFMKAKPPLMALAWLNLRHWQSSSDQNNILHYARVPMLYMAGVNATEKQETTTIGAGAVYKTTNENAKVGWVEHTGAAVKSGADDLAAIEGMMEVLGLAPLVERTQNSTAFAKMSHDQRRSGGLQAWVRRLEQTLESLYEMAAKFAKEELPEDFAIDVFSDFNLSIRSDEDLNHIIGLRGSKDLSRETTWNELVRRGTLHPDFDPEEEQKLLEEERESEMPPLLPGGLPFDPEGSGEPQVDPETGKTLPPAPPGSTQGAPRPPFARKRGGVPPKGRKPVASA